MAKPPDQSRFTDEDSSSNGNNNDGADNGSPWVKELDTKPYETVLKPLEIPELPPRKLPEPILGHGGGPLSGLHDLTALTKGDEIRLLKINKIYLTQMEGDKSGAGTMCAYSLSNSDFKASDERALRITEVRLEAPNKSGITVDTYSYEEFESKLQQYVVNAGSLKFGIPALFSFKGSHEYSSGFSSKKTNINIFCQRSQIIQKAEVIINQKNVSLTPEFVEDVKTACDEDTAEQLLDVLERYGQFVPTHIVLGGKAVMSTSTEISDVAQVDARKTTFLLASAAQFAVDGIPVTGGTGGGTQTGNTTFYWEGTKQVQLSTATWGGDPSAYDSREGGTLGAKWVPTLAPCTQWRVIGFRNSSLVPIIDLLADQRLRERCWKKLRAYFLSKLHARASAAAGHRSGKKFDHGTAKVKRIDEIKVHHGGNVDELIVSYEKYLSPGTATIVTMPAIDNSGPQTDTIPLEDGNRITAIEVGTKLASEGDVLTSWPSGP